MIDVPGGFAALALLSRAGHRPADTAVIPGAIEIDTLETRRTWHGSIRCELANASACIPGVIDVADVAALNVAGERLFACGCPLDGDEPLNSWVSDRGRLAKLLLVQEFVDQTPLPAAVELGALRLLLADAHEAPGARDDRHGDLDPSGTAAAAAALVHLSAVEIAWTAALTEDGEQARTWLDSSLRSGIVHRGGQVPAPHEDTPQVVAVSAVDVDFWAPRDIVDGPSTSLWSVVGLADCITTIPPAGRQPGRLILVVSALHSRWLQASGRAAVSLGQLSPDPAQNTPEVFELAFRLADEQEYDEPAALALARGILHPVPASA